MNFPATPPCRYRVSAGVEPSGAARSPRMTYGRLSDRHGELDVFVFTTANATGVTVTVSVARAVPPVDAAISSTPSTSRWYLTCFSLDRPSTNHEGSDDPAKCQVSRVPWENPTMASVLGDLHQSVLERVETIVAQSLRAAEDLAGYEQFNPDAPPDDALTVVRLAVSYLFLDDPPLD